MINSPNKIMNEKKLVSSKSRHKKVLRELRLKKLEKKLISNIAKRKKNIIENNG